MLTGTKVRLRSKRLGDARDEYAWRTDPELAALDAALPLAATFTDYLALYASELRYSIPTSRRFAIDTLDGKYIGNCSFYDINNAKGEAELGILIGDRDYWNRGYGTDAVATLLRYIFGETELKRVFLKTLESNIRAQKSFQKCGFTASGHMKNDGYSFMLMEIQRPQWQAPTANRGLHSLSSKGNEDAEEQ
ncbi:GNAT family N-acetyltransferase [Chloroflexota bacterium]